jgi:lysozyme
MNLTQQLRLEESVEKSAYQDSLGFWTIGVGRLIDARKGGGLSDKEINYLLANDIESKTLEVVKALPWFYNLNEPRQAVILGMAFQLGTNGMLGFKTSLGHIRGGRWDLAHDGMLDSAWAKQTPARANRMADQMLTGEWQVA